MTEKDPVPDPRALAAWRKEMEKGVRGTGFSGYGDFVYKPSTDQKDRQREGTYQM